MCRRFGTFKDSDIREELREKAIEKRKACIDMMNCARWQKHGPKAPLFLSKPGYGPGFLIQVIVNLRRGIGNN